MGPLSQACFGNSIPLDRVGIFVLSRICPPGVSCFPFTCQSSGRAAALILWIMQQWCLHRRPSCRSTNKDVWRQSVEERGWARVCSGSSTANIKGICRRQFRVTCSSADSPHRRMTMKPEVKSCWRKAELSAVATVKFWCTQTQDSRGIAGDSSLHVLLILPQWQSNTSFSVTSHIFSLNPLKTPSTAVH